MKQPATETIGDYVLLRRVGAGAYADVWLARDAVGKLVAVKVIDLERLKLMSRKNREEEALALLRNQLPEHPHLIRVHHVGTEASRLYYVMDLADDANRDVDPRRPDGHRDEGAGKKQNRDLDPSRDREGADGSSLTNDPQPRTVAQAKACGSGAAIDVDSYRPFTLSEEIERRAPVALRDAIVIVEQLLSAVGALHDRGIIHRDVKPSNVVRVDGTWKLADIGLLTHETAEVTAIGTPDFMPPSGKIDRTADIFALGRLLYCLVTGRPARAFPSIQEALLTVEHREAVSELNEVITRACAPDPARRFASATAFDEALAECMRHIETGGLSRRKSNRRLPLRPVFMLPLVTFGLYIGAKFMKPILVAMLATTLPSQTLLFTVGLTSTCEVPSPLNSNADIDFGNDSDPQLATDVLGNVIAVWQSKDFPGTGTDLDILYSISNDGGATWTVPLVLNSNGSFDNTIDFSPRIAMDGFGTWIVVWVSRDTLEDTIGSDRDILFSRSTDYGSTWSDAAPLTADAATDLGNDELPVITTDGAGNWVVAWATNDSFDEQIGADFDIMITHSIDSGVTWQPPIPLNTNAATDTGDDFDPAIVADGLGRWIVTWQSRETFDDVYGSDWDIFYAKSIDVGATWTDPEPVNSNAATDSGDDMNSSLSIDELENMMVVWQSDENLSGTIGNDLDILIALTSDCGTTWTAPAALNSNAPGDNGIDREPYIITDWKGRWIVLWQSSDTLSGTLGSDFDILSSSSWNAGLTWTAATPLCLHSSSDNGDDLNPHLVSDGTGRWIAAWWSVDSLLETIGTDRDILYTRFILERGSRTVTIDIKPGSDPNSINLGSHGVIPVAILTTDDFDATLVDPDTVELAGATVAIRGNGKRTMASKEDVNGDGFIDLLLMIETENLNLEIGTTEAILTAQTYDGQSIRGSDSINIVPD